MPRWLAGTLANASLSQLKPKFLSTLEPVLPDREDGWPRFPREIVPHFPYFALDNERQGPLGIQSISTQLPHWYQRAKRPPSRDTASNPCAKYNLLAASLMRSRTGRCDFAEAA